MEFIRLRGVRTHNLRGFNLDLPRGRLTVLTGPSGSGKSSLAFDTLYAEGQRRYVESLSAYARQFLELMDKPEVEHIEGLSPAIAIQQRVAAANPRSTVGTVTEVHDFLRVLYARAGRAHCPDHPGQGLEPGTVSAAVDLALSLPAGTALWVLAPLPDRPGAALAERLAPWRAQGFVRYRAQGQIFEGESPPADLPGDTALDVVVDRLQVRDAARARLTESIETAWRVGDGRVVLLERDSGHAHVVAGRAGCPVCGYTAPLLEPRLFSFNNPAGACTACDGLGRLAAFTAARVVAHPELTLEAGAIPGWDARSPANLELLRKLALTHGVDLCQPWCALPAAFCGAVLQGDPSAAFEGIVPILERRWRAATAPEIREALAALREESVCPECGGARLSRAARHVYLDGAQGRLALPALEALPLDQAAAALAGLGLEGARAEIAAPVLSEVRARVAFLLEVGLGYLSLDRRADTLSGGEAQRIRLASQIGSGLTGVLYVLDEPSIGLHARDNRRLIDTLLRLRDLGNSVVVVEHDEEMIRSADHVVDLGPGAGLLGGAVVGQGRPEELEHQPGSLTGDYLAGRRRIAPEGARRSPGEQRLVLAGATGNNLRGVDLDVPLGCLVCVTGVSGSGKSTLVLDTLAPALARLFHGARETAAPFRGLEGAQALTGVVRVDQSPIGRTPRSNPATYCGLFTPIRELFAATVTARERGYGAGRFSFNTPGGRCEHCQGEGTRRIEMHLLPDVRVVCEHCNGRRFNRETLDVVYRGANIAEVLDLTIDEAAQRFSAHAPLVRRLEVLQGVGLGYLRLGQPADTLSGGEAQRLRLAVELARRGRGHLLYILDEPTTGLHFHDIAQLLAVLLRLRDAGHTVLVIEHNLDVIATADWIVDLGPEGGSGGGAIVASGTPEQVAQVEQSHTGRYLAAHLTAKKPPAQG
jgi:excinuclease ABC subunit A